MARKDYYSILGVDKGASGDEIKRAYRKLARKLHPDVNPGDSGSEERFKEVAEAYHVLGDEERRQQYDRVGPELFSQEYDLSGFADQFSRLFRDGRVSGGPGGSGFGLFEELLGGLGGSGAGRGGFDPTTRGGGPRPPSPEVELRIGLAEAVSGTERQVRLQTPDGNTLDRRVRIPAGIRDGDRIRLPANGAAGDVMLRVRVAAHPRFELRGSDLRTTVPVTVYEAALGARVQVPTLDGHATIELPAGTRNGQLFRLRGKGAPRKRGSAERGDLLARVAVQMPEQIDDELRALMRRFRDEHPYTPRADG